jgi:hypothetical protein
MARRKRARSASAALQAAPAKAMPRPSAPALPVRAVLARQFEFYGTSGSLHRWQEGAVVTDPVEIAMLIESRAPLKEAA